MLSGTSVVYERKVVTTHIRTYNWPPLQLNFWIFIMLLCSSTIIGVFGNFIQIQNQLELPIPWCVFTVSFLSSNNLVKQLKANSNVVQVFSLLHHGRRHCDLIHIRHLLVDCSTSAATCHRHDRRLCALRLVARGSRRCIARALGTQRIYPGHL